MGSLESGVPLKRESLFGSSSATRRPGSRFCRFLLFKKLDYLQWISTVLVFLFFLVWFPMFLPGLVMDKSHANDVDYGNLMHLKEIGGFDFGEDIVFEPSMLLEKFHREAVEFNLSASFNGTRRRFGYRKPQLALVFPDLLVDPQQLLMVTVASALQEIGYEIQIYSFEDGPVHEVWKNMGIPVTIVQTSHKMEIVVDWLNYDGIIVNSLEATGIFSRLMQEPFKSVPLIWTIHEKALALCLREYNSRGQIALVNDWKKVFNRATVVVFPNYALPIIYSAFDAGNYYVIPGSPVEAWKANTITELHKDDLRVKMGYGPEDFVIAIVGSQFLYKGLWLEHALVLQALLPLFADFSFEGNSSSHLKVLVLSGDSTGNYSVAVEAIARNLKYPRGTVKFISVDVDANIFLSTADAVIYGSFLEEKSFPQFLIKAMCFGKPIIAPDLSIIRKYVDDRVNGFLFPKENIEVLTRIMLIVISNGKLSPLSLSVASIARATAKNLMVSETVEGYASLLKSVIKLPSEVAAPKSVKEIQPKLKEEWCWHLFEAFKISAYEARMLRSSRYIKKIEEQWNHTQRESSGSKTALDDSFFYDIWEEQKFIEVFNSKKRREEEELKDRTDQTRGTWEEVYRSAKRADRTKNDLHERDEGELERTGQPLCLYEPYFGEGTWSFLHLNSLYRGIGLSTRGRRPGTDDIDAPSRLPLLSNPYYRDALGEYGAFFAISNRIDRIHKNAWIGFQSWRATARKWQGDVLWHAARQLLCHVSTLLLGNYRSQGPDSCN